MSGEEKGAGIGGLMNPSLLVLVVSIMGYLVSNPVLKSVRPELASLNSVPPPPSPPPLSGIHSRLWDDPLWVAYQHSQRLPADERTSIETLADLLDRFSKDDEPDAPSVAELFRRVVETVAGGPNERMLCLPVFVSGEPYAVDTEQRKRTTYAVLSALGTLHYDLTYPDRLSYVTVPIQVDDQVSAEPIRVDNLVVPIKLLEKSDASDGVPREGPKAVLVCWINEAQLGSRPLAALGQVLEQLFCSVPNLSTKLAVHILGPTSSDGLLDMAREDNEPKQKPDEGADGPPGRKLSNAYVEAAKPGYFSRYNDPKLYSGSATVSADGLADAERKSLIQFCRGPTRCGLHVIRSIGTDELLLQRIVGELKLRGAWPWPDQSASASTANGADQGRYIVLVCERDSLFGRALPGAFRRVSNNVLTPWDRRGRTADPLQVFSYLQGLDGQLPEKSGHERGPTYGEPAASGPKPEGGAAAPFTTQPGQPVPATGRSQFDYLRRLEEDLLRFHREKVNAGQLGIVAIGVLGTDVYDKLLVLQALRARFPQICFFTTDCDADYCLEPEYPTSRNLIIASHFGLQLHPDLQREAPAFRDSYQTAQYFQSLLALGDKAIPPELADDPWQLKGGMPANGLEPLTFEVARHGLYQLTSPSQTNWFNAHVQPPGPREAHWLWRPRHVLCALLAAAALAALVCHMVTLPHVTDRRWGLLGGIAFAGVFLLVLATAAWDHGRADGEPFELFEGISTWPSTLLRTLAALLSVGLLYKATVDLTVDSGKRDEQLRPRGVPDVADDPRGWYPSARQWLQRVVKVSRPGWLGRFWEGLKQDLLISNWPDERSARSAELRDGYHRRGTTGLRLLRSLVMAAIYMVFSSLLFAMTGLPNTPYRGPVAQAWATSILTLSVSLMIWLTFFVFDATLLCRRFVKNVVAERPDWPAESAGMVALQQHKQPHDLDDARELLTLRIIAERTQVVGKLVTYPFWVLLLVILSRHSIFDFFDFPPALFIMWGLSLGGILICAAALRGTARDARDKVLSRLRDSLATTAGREEPAWRGRAEQLRQFIAEIKQEDRGAFRPLMQDPIVTALATLFGGTGGIVLLEQFLPFH
ncbi:MAG TPA: hypothetical protein VHC22_28945 [Pirellulales bacterium]|nr:hypothetical protein [Pirellulales bacterium]